MSFRLFLPLIWLIAPLVLLLHKNHREGLGVFKYYVDQANIIANNFSIPSSIYGSPEYPMWIYGWLLTLTEDPNVIVIFQMVLAVSSICLFIYMAMVDKLADRGAISIFSFILLISIPWYALHSVLGPYSVASSLLVLLSIFTVRLIKELGTKSINFLLCWICLVLLLQTRSEYLVFWPGLILFVLICRCVSLSIFIRLLTVFLAAILFVVPWGLYSNNIDKHWHLTTGGGYEALIVSLGQLPDNKWGVIARDDEPRIYHAIKKYYGENVHPFTYRAAIPLKNKFFDLVYEKPYEWARKVVWIGFKVITGGTFEGEFYAPGDDRAQKCVSCLKRLKSGELPSRWGDVLSFKCILMAASKILGILVVFISYLLLPVGLYIAIKNKNIFHIIIIYCMLFQIAVSSVFLYKTRFTSIIYPMILLNLCITVGYIFRNYFASQKEKIVNKKFTINSKTKKITLFGFCSLLIVAIWAVVVVNLYQYKPTDIFRGIGFGMTKTVERVISQHPSAVSLSDNGGEWNPPGEETNIFKPRGPWTPLQMAVAGGHYFIAELLLKHGADPLNGPDQSGLYPVHLAARIGSVPLLKILEKAGADLRAVASKGNYQGMTPLHLAAMRGQLNASVYLIERGVPCDLPDNFGFTPTDYAVKNGYWKVSEYLAASCSKNKGSARTIP